MGRRKSVCARSLAQGAMVAVMGCAAPSVQAAAGIGAPVERQFVIPAQDMTRALEAFGQQSESAIIFDARQVAGRQSKAINGAMTPIDALRSMTRESGLQVGSTGVNGFVVRAAPATAALRPFRRAFRQLALAGAAAAASPMIIATPALSQEPTALADVIVTAQKRSENLQQTPIAITAIQAQALAARGAQSILDLNTNVPNLFVGGAGAAGRQAGTFFIRGVGIDVDTLAREPAVGLYIDDFYYGHTAGSLLSVLDVESIEVLRGPQGTLFGKNTIGGAVRYTSVKPGFNFGGNVEANYGEMDRKDLKGSVNIPLSKTLALRLSAATLNQDGYIRSIPLNKDLGDEHTTSVRGQLRYADDKWDILATADYTRGHNNGQPSHLDIINPSPTASATLYNKIVSGQAPVPFYSAALYAGLTAPKDLYDSRYLAGPYETYATNVGYRLRGHGFSLTAAYKFNDNLTLKSLTGYRKNKVFYRNDNDQSPLNWNQNNIDQTLPSFSEEVQLLGKAFNDKLNYIVGLYYYHETPRSRNDRMFPGEPDGNQQFDDIKTTSKAVFAQVDYQLIDKVKLTLGARYSDDKKDVNIVRTKVLLTAAGLAGTPQGSTATGFVPTTATTFGPISGAGVTNFTNFSPKAAIQVQWTLEIMTYGSVSKGYRAGGFNNGIAVYNPTTLANPNNGILPFNNETDWTYEVGARTEFFERRLRVNVSLFDSEYRDLQIASAQITGVGSASFQKIDNVAKARLQGGEAEVLWRPVRDLTLGGNYGYLDAKYLEISPTVTAVNLKSRLAGAPRTTYALNATYNPQLSNGGDIAFYVNWGHQSQVATSTSAAGQVRLPAYGLLSGSIFYTFPDKKVSIGVTGKNILDKRYVISGTSLVAVAAGNAGVQYTNVGRPSEVYATVRYKF